MARDWMKHTVWSQQKSTFGSQSETTGYKAHDESFELQVRRRPALRDKKPEPTTAVTTTATDPDTTGEATNTTSTSPDQIPDGFVLQPRKIVKSFKLATHPFGFNVTFTEATKSQPTPVYYAVNSELTPKQPDIVLHAGKDKNGDRLAVAYFRFSRHIRMGFGGETLRTGGGVWEEMRNTSGYLGHTRYEFEYNVPDDEVDFSGASGVDSRRRTRKRFLWLRTRDEADGVRGVVEKTAGWKNYKLVEQGSGQVLAVILGSMFSGCSDVGMLNLHQAMPKEMEQVVVLTAACICEKGERRLRHWAYGGVCALSP